MSAVGLFATLLFPVFVAAQPPCTVVDNGTGTVDLPPPGCGYLSPSDVHMIINGLPPGTTIRVGIEHQKFFMVTHSPGGSLGGEVEQFGSILIMHMQGTGELAGYNRNLGMQIQSEIHTAPRTPGSPLQSFDTDMFRSQGELPPGDPDFDLLRITAGTGFGMPSPGHTTLTRNGPPGSDWNVDSFFDITYRIDFAGAPGGPLSGYMGSTTATIRMGTGQPAPPESCVVDDNGTGTVNLPPQGCGYVSPQDLHMMINGLPAGTTVVIGPEHDRFFGTQTMPGGSLGGEIEQFQSFLTLHMQGTGNLNNYTAQKQMQVNCEVHSAPRMPGTSPQVFATDMQMLGGQLPAGDPDFDLLRITAGTGFGMSSPGGTILTRMGTEAGGPPQWHVDSFFDIEYRIDFVGRAGGPFGGMSGSTTGTIRMQTGNPPITGIAEESAAPANQSQILVNHPDPFNPSTMIEFVLAKAGRTELEVYDASGRLVRRLIDQDFPAGRHEARWDGLDASAGKVGSGTYFIKLKLDGKAIGTEKATIVK